MNAWQERPRESSLSAGPEPLRRVGDLQLAFRASVASQADMAPSSYPVLPGDAACAIALPPPGPLPRHGRTLAQLIERRRSGAIAPGPVPPATWGALLDAALEPPLGSRMRMFPEELQPVVFPVVFDFEGVAPGAYRHDPVTRQLLPVAAIERGRMREDVLLQWDHGGGAAIFFLAVPMARILHAYGDRGYKHALMSLGFVSDRLYLFAEHLGLTYTVTAGFAYTTVDELLGLDGYHYTVPFSFIVGGPRPPARAATQG